MYFVDRKEQKLSGRVMDTCMVNWFLISDIIRPVWHQEGIWPIIPIHFREVSLIMQVCRSHQWRMHYVKTESILLGQRCA